MSEYGYGRRKEFQLKEFLERRGYAVGFTPHSEGPADLLALSGRRK
jgi:Holliday junction resolvase